MNFRAVKSAFNSQLVFSSVDFPDMCLSEISPRRSNKVEQQYRPLANSKCMHHCSCKDPALSILMLPEMWRLKVCVHLGDTVRMSTNTEYLTNTCRHSKWIHHCSCHTPIISILILSEVWWSKLKCIPELSCISRCYRGGSQSCWVLHWTIWHSNGSHNICHHHSFSGTCITTLTPIHNSDTIK